jgi:hypothetical protein
MADVEYSPSENGHRKSEHLGKSNLEIVNRRDEERAYVHDSLDPIYVAKAKILNDAFSEIGMGRYQVGLL